MPIFNVHRPWQINRSTREQSIIENAYIRSPKEKERQSTFAAENYIAFKGSINLSFINR